MTLDIQYVTALYYIYIYIWTHRGLMLPKQQHVDVVLMFVFQGEALRGHEGGEER